ncbi:hypothetical protein BpHYR1_005379 [Brachionus plicatilis]|uniref:Uncharacterized protein n=1 Tax=Brachionus plicatilis TaxID=10195 RepID=A0A3M7RHH1_BRAPC|nr:hypothetical protein BpHYR1_005379 [Brachionus plicatilis]
MAFDCVCVLKLKQRLNTKKRVNKLKYNELELEDTVVFGKKEEDVITSLSIVTLNDSFKLATKILNFPCSTTR